MSGQGYAAVNWDRFATFGLSKGNPARWKLNRHAPEGHTVPGKGMKIKPSGNTVPLHFPEVDSAYGVTHSVVKPVKLEKKRLSQVERKLAKEVMAIAKKQGLSCDEASQLLKAKLDEALTPRVVMEYR